MPCRSWLVPLVVLVVRSTWLPLAADAHCPTAVFFEPTGRSTTDAGWTGLHHDLPLAGPTLLLGIACAASEPPCGTCTIAGVIPDPILQPQRCLYDHSVPCTVGTEVADCGGPGRCRTLVGPPETIAGGGIATCVLQNFASTVGGTVDVETGDFTPTIPLRVQIGGGLGIPCARCVGDAVANDGLKNGTCDDGLHEGNACDANATSPFGDFGSTSFDCPQYFGAEFSTGAIAASTGTMTRSLSVLSPNCGGSAPGRKCMCQTCNTLAAEPCFTNADCPPSGGTPGVCGGSRCIGGGNAGAPCSAVSACPGGSCNRVGEPTKPDACIDDSTTPFDCLDLGGGRGTCLLGPFMTFCTNHPNRTCETDSHCDGVSGACQATSRPCFADNGIIGAGYAVTGTATPPVANVSEPTDLAVLGCVGSTTSAVANFVGGYPGLVRSMQPGRLTFGDAVLPTPRPTPTATAGPATPTPVPGPCPALPGACRVHGTAKLRLTDRVPDDKDQLRWQWAKGATTTIAELGQPLTTDAYALCLYDDTGLRATLEIPPGGTCDGKPCWRQTSSGFQYQNKGAAPHGITRLSLKASAGGSATLQAQGRGAFLPLPALPSFGTHLQVQLRNHASGLCWNATFVAPFDQRTDAQLEDRAD